MAERTKSPRQAKRVQSMHTPNLNKQNGNVPPPLPPRPAGGLSRYRHSVSVSESESSTHSSSFPPTSPPPSASDHTFPPGSSPPPPVPSAPRPFIPGFSTGRPPAALPSDPTISLPASLPSFHPPPSAGSLAPPKSADPRYTERPKLTPTPASVSTLTPEQLRARIGMQSQNTEELLEILKNIENDKLTPHELVGRFGKYFPFRVRVEKGFYSNRAEIVAGEIYNIHFLKKARVIAITDTMGEKFVLPLNAAMRMGFEQEGQPEVYKCVADIINAEKPPKLICSLDSHTSNDKRFSFKKDEVMVVKGIYTTKVRRAKSLKVLSLNNLEEKRLSSDCPVAFSTDPMYTQLPLIDIVNQVPEMIPGMAKLCPTVDVEDMGFPGHLVTETVKVKRQYVEKSLITTLCPEEQEGASHAPPQDPFAERDTSALKTIYDIPLSLDIEFSIIPPEVGEDIYEYTDKVYAEFDLRKLQSGDGTGLHMAIDENNMYSGVDLELPPYYNYDPAHPEFIPPGTKHRAAHGDRSLSQDQDEPPPLPKREPHQPKRGCDSDQDSDEYTEVDFGAQSPSHSAPGTDVPPPLPANHPPPRQPEGARPPPPVSPRLPRKSSKESPQQPPPQQPPQPPPQQPLPPPPQTEPTPPPPEPVASAPAPAHRKEMSPAESCDSYVDTAELDRPRMPSPELPEISPEAELENDYEVAQQMEDLRHTMLTLRSQMMAIEHQKSPSHKISGKVSFAELKQMQEDLKRISPYPQKIIAYCRSLEVEMTTLRTHLTTQLQKASATSVADENKQFLCSLDVVQTITLLEKLNMAQYQDRFAQECIDGGILAMCDDETLEKELGVSSRLERLRLMRIIRGERSAKSILEGEYNYVTLESK